ncbi:ABC transporter substrate-binding protein [Neobacillus cucumis]|nr:ABC transporter substrate-binding protein [Neobacillus cucumis]
MKGKRRLFKNLLAMIVLVLALSACSSNSSTTTSTENGASKDAGKPTYGGTLVRADIYGDPQNLDPAIRSHGTSTSMITWNIFEPLVRYDAVKGKFLPANAESWEISTDGKVYSFTLRKGVKFHNGREVTAEDFKYTLERVLNPKTASPNAGSLTGIVGSKEFMAGKSKEVSGIKVVNSTKLEITLSKPDNTFLTIMSLPFTGAVPKEVVEEKGDKFGQEPVGAGPFKFSKWVRDSEVDLVANEDYYAGKPYLEKVDYIIMTDQTARDNAFASKQIDMMVLGDAQYKRYATDPSYKSQIVEVPELFTRNMKFNLDKKGPWQDVRVRQAINYAIDRDTIIGSVIQGKAYSALGVLPTSIQGFNKAVTSYKYEPKKAKKLLEEAGYGNGFTLNILTTSHPAFGLPAVEALSGYLEKVGIKVKTEQVDFATLTDRLNSGNYEVAMSSNGGSTNPVEYLSRYFHSKNDGASGNTSHYKNPAVDTLLDKASETTDNKEMISDLQKAEDLIVKDAPWWFFNYNKAVIVHQKWIKGLQPVPTDIDYQDLTKVWVDESQK